jgi:hypothetical protein
MLRGALTLVAETTVQDAISALQPYPDITYVVIKRWQGTDLFWYTRKVSDIRNLAHLGHQTLAEALNLSAGPFSRILQRRKYSRRKLASLSGILLDGQRVMGVLVSSRDFSHHDLLDEAGSSPPLAADSSAQAKTLSPYPRLEAPDNVASGQAFDLTIGLSREQLPGIAGGPWNIETNSEEFDLTLQVFAEGFGSPGGLRPTLHVFRSRFEEAESRVKLIAPQVKEVLLAALEVQYSYQGQVVGKAWREIRVVPLHIQPPAGEPKKGAQPVSTPAPEGAPDLTVTLKAGRDGRSLFWAFDTYPPQPGSEDAISTHLGQDSAQTFAFSHIQTIAESDGQVNLDDRLRGVGRKIAARMPPQFWQILDRVWSQVKLQGKTPSLLLISEDPYIPWELAVTEAPFVREALVDPSFPPFLGSQLKMGRWLPPGPDLPAGSLHPRLPPETVVKIARMALVVGDYEENQELPEAKAEGKDLKTLCPAIQLGATLADMDRLLDGQLREDGQAVAVQAIHFACHGSLFSDPRYSGILLSDSGVRLGEDLITGNTMTHKDRPFVFANACEVGQATVTLGAYGGLAAAFLGGGCRGFIAPLWKIDDKVAHQIAVYFYRRTLINGIEVSEVLREVRSRFDMTQEMPAATYLAYVYYGHPGLVLKKDNKEVNHG